MVVQTRIEAHPASRPADLVETLAHVLEGPGLVRVFAVRGKNHEMVRPEFFEEVHGCCGAADDLGAAHRVVGRAVERNSNDMATAPFSFFLHLRGGDVVGLEDLRKLRQAKADEARVLHDIEQVGEGNTGEVVPQVRTQPPLHVFVGGQTAGRTGKRGGHSTQYFTAGHHGSNRMDQTSSTLRLMVLITESILPFSTCLARLRVNPSAAWNGICDGSDSA